MVVTSFYVSGACSKLHPFAIKTFVLSTNYCDIISYCCFLGLLPSTENDVKSFARETVVGGFLGVTVKKGSQLVRKKDDSKLHHSYEVHDHRVLFYFIFCGHPFPGKLLPISSLIGREVAELSFFAVSFHLLITFFLNHFLW